MPRVSKKLIKDVTIQPDNIITNTKHIYRAAIYLRLSFEDVRKKMADSIGTQKEMLVSFLKTKADIRLYDIYEDVNYTGTNFNRPGFTKMIDEIQAGLVDCVVVKDLSRFGRNFKETGHYLERIFPFLQVRFISVNDNFDSLTASIDESGLIVPLKNLINEVYARDCSKKTKSGFHAKQQRGEFSGAYAPYGYVKEGSSFIIDEEAALIVKKIFEWRLEGLGFPKICQRLNELRISPPSKHHYEKGRTKAKKYEEAVFWYTSAIKRILDNPTYTGILALSKYKSNFLHGGGIIETKKDEWIVFENAHQPIIDKDTYEAAQKLSGRKKMGELKKDVETDPNIFKGLIFCGDCGKHMYRSSRRKKFTYVCSIYNTVNKHACTMKPIKEAELRTAVFAAINSQMNLAADMEKLIIKLHESSSYQKDVASIEYKIIDVKKKLEQIQGFKNTLHEDCNAGILSTEDFALMNNDFESEKATLQLKLDELAEEKAKHETTFSPKNRWIAEFRMFEKEEQLTAQMLMVLLERIDVYDNNRLEIVFRYRDELEALKEHIINYKARDAYD